MGLREQSERKAPEKYFTKISLKYAMTLTYKLCSKSHSILYPRVICGWNWSLTVCIIFQTSDIRHTSTYIVIWLHRPKKKGTIALHPTQLEDCHWSTIVIGQPTTFDWNYHLSSIWQEFKKYQDTFATFTVLEVFSPFFIAL